MLGTFSHCSPIYFFLRQDLSVRAGAHQYGYPASPGAACPQLSDVGITGGLPQPFCMYVYSIDLNSAYMYVCSIDLNSACMYVL